jgi:hypothetical protein
MFNQRIADAYCVLVADHSCDARKPSRGGLAPHGFENLRLNSLPLWTSGLEWPKQNIY